MLVKLGTDQGTKAENSCGICVDESLYAIRQGMLLAWALIPDAGMSSLSSREKLSAAHRWLTKGLKSIEDEIATEVANLNIRTLTSSVECFRFGSVEIRHRLEDLLSRFNGEFELISEDPDVELGARLLEADIDGALAKLLGDLPRGTIVSIVRE